MTGCRSLRSSGMGFPARFSRLLLLVPILLAGCSSETEELAGPAGTPALREALFDSILVWTARRGAFSQPKQETLGYDPLEEMEKVRGRVVGAETQDDLFYALSALSNARRDRHLSLGLVPGGLRPGFTDGLEVWDGSGPAAALGAWSGPEPADPLEAPVRFRPDFASADGGYFVSDVAEGQAWGEGDAEVEPEVGDRVVGLNGLSVEAFEAAALPFIRHSSVAGFRWKLAEALSLRTALFPPELVGEVLELEIVKADGSRGTVTLPYLPAEELAWSGLTEPAYPGFAMEWSTPTYDLYLPTEGQGALVLQWHRFESSSLMEDVDRLVALGEERGLLDHAILFDATRSGGGSLGAYAVQRLQPRPFKTTFGTLRLSDVIEPFAREKREQFAEERIFDSGSPETVDDGTWLMDWIENDLLDALERGDSVTAPVPFKTAHAPKDSDGILHPAPVHFRGPLVVFSGPSGGSHLDQFMSIVADNDLGPILGMPAGGYSNTWEWEEVLYLPGTDQPVVGFMWSIGHTIRPNGEVLEGNPAPVDEWIPLTAENATEYYRILLEAAWDYLAGTGFSVRGG